MGSDSCWEDHQGGVEAGLRDVHKEGSPEAGAKLAGKGKAQSAQLGFAQLRPWSATQNQFAPLPGTSCPSPHSKIKHRFSKDRDEGHMSHEAEHSLSKTPGALPLPSFSATVTPGWRMCHVLGCRRHVQRQRRCPLAKLVVIWFSLWRGVFSSVTQRCPRVGAP